VTAEPDRSAARLADAALAAALAAVAAGGGEAAWCEVGVGADGRLRKGRLVPLRVGGRLAGAPFAIARTTIVGFDTLSDQVDLCARVLRALERCTARVARGDVTALGSAGGRDVTALGSAGGRDPAALGSADVPDPVSSGSAGGPEPASLRSPEGPDPLSVPPLHCRAEPLGHPDVAVWYVEVRCAHRRDQAVLGDMVRVGADEPALTSMAHRLWL
jgi:hypothetical protein